MKAKKEKKGLVYKKFQELKEKKNFKEFLTRTLEIGDEARWAWQYEIVQNERDTFLKENPDFLFDMFKKEYKDIFSERQLKIIENKIKRFECVKRI